MNDPPSDVNGSIIDIFVLSVSETVTSLFTEHLEKKGYRVTLFTDGSYLLETLREGKPNLLICDTTTLDEEGFEVCRQIKSDDDLWVIPVLILTTGSSLTDLLRILDCNADNFITHPFDLSYCLSVIDSMLSIPVERRTPDQIKTQFKISHDDQIYVVAANRRKLLEFLLSSFEITVNQSSELSRIKSDLLMLSESATTLEDRVLEQTRVIERIHETVQQKEQKISALNREVGEDKKILAQKSDVIDHLSGQLDDDKTLLATYEENLRKSIQERKDIESALQSEIDSLRNQISKLLHDADITKTSLDTVQGELEDEKIHGTSLECTLELLVSQKELAEKTLQALTLEHEQLNSAFADEKNRALSAEQEIQTLMQAKTQAEQEFTAKSNGLNDEIHSHAADLARVKEELDAGTNQRIALENSLEKLRTEKIQSESSLQSSITTLKEQLGELQEKYESARAALETEESTTTSLKENLAEVVAEKERTLQALTLEHDQLNSALADEKNRVLSAEQEFQKGMHEKAQSESSLQSSITTLKEQLGELQEKYESTRAALETEESTTTSLKENLAEVVAEKERTLQALTLEHDQLNSALADEKNRALSAEQEIQTLMQAKTQAEQEQHQNQKELNETLKQQSLELARLKSELDEAAKKRISTENQVGMIRQEREQSESSLISAMNALKEQLGDLQEKYEAARTALETEETRTKSLKENLTDIIAEKEKTEEMLKTDRDSYKATFLRLKHDLDEAACVPVTLERELNLAKSQNKTLADELNLAYQGKAQISQQVHSLLEELEQVKAALALEQSLHKAGKESHDTDKEAVQRMAQDLHKFSEERASLDQVLENECRLRLTAEEKTKEAAQKQGLLEQEILAINNERTRQENERALKVQNLEKEFEQVGDLQKSLEVQVNILTKEKLQAEKTIQVLTNELDQARTALADEWEDHMISVAAAFKERQRLQQGSPSPTAGAGQTKEKSLDSRVQKPVFPAIVDSASHALVNVVPPDIQKSPVSEKDLVLPETIPEITVISPAPASDSSGIFDDEDIVNADVTETGEKEEDFSPISPVSAGEDAEMISPEADLADADEDEPAEDYRSTIPDEYATPMSHGVFSFSRRQWFDVLKWARHSGTLSHDQRIQIVRMGRLIQKDRKLTKKQEEQVNEMIALVQALGYRPS